MTRDEFEETIIRYGDARIMADVYRYRTLKKRIITEYDRKDALIAQLVDTLGKIRYKASIPFNVPPDSIIVKTFSEIEDEALNAIRAVKGLE